MGPVRIWNIGRGLGTMNNKNRYVLIFRPFDVKSKTTELKYRKQLHLNKSQKQQCHLGNGSMKNWIWNVLTVGPLFNWKKVFSKSNLFQRIKLLLKTNNCGDHRSSSTFVISYCFWYSFEIGQTCPP